MYSFFIGKNEQGKWVYVPPLLDDVYIDGSIDGMFILISEILDDECRRLNEVKITNNTRRGISIRRGKIQKAPKKSKYLDKSILEVLMIRFLPGDVKLTFPTPLMDTMKKAEYEFTSALILYILARTGNKWRRLSIKEISDYISNIEFDSIEDAGLIRCFQNPFVKLDLNGIVAKGFATLEEDGYCFTYKTMNILDKFNLDCQTDFSKKPY